MLKKVLTFCLKFGRILFVRRSGGMADAQASGACSRKVRRSGGMADAQASGACSRKAVWVQVPSPALNSSETAEEFFYVRTGLGQTDETAFPDKVFNFIWFRRSGGMADAQASGACSRKAVWVQVPSPAYLSEDSFPDRKADFCTIRTAGCCQPRMNR